MRQRATAQTSIANRGRASLSAQVAALFAAGMKGLWRESSRAGVRYVENTGVTPANTPGDTLGLILSLDQGGGRGAEIWPTPPSSVPAGWTNNGDGSYTHAAGTASSIGSASGAAPGRWYEVSFVVSGRTAGAVTPYAGSTGAGAAVAVNGAAIQRILAAGAFGMYVFANAAFDGTVSVISYKEIPGNHQSQPTTQSRPLYQVSPPRPVFDGIDDVLNTTFAAALGTNCTVGRYVPGTGVVILTGQNIGTTFADSVTSGPLVVLDGPLNAGQTATLAAYLTQQGTLP